MHFTGTKSNRFNGAPSSPLVQMGSCKPYYATSLAESYKHPAVCEPGMEI